MCRDRDNEYRACDHLVYDNVGVHRENRRTVEKTVRDDLLPSFLKMMYVIRRTKFQAAF